MYFQLQNEKASEETETPSSSKKLREGPISEKCYPILTVSKLPLGTLERQWFMERESGDFLEWTSSRFMEMQDQR